MIVESGLQIPGGNLRAAYEMWDAHRSGRVMPGWRQFPMSGLAPKLLPIAAVVDVIGDGRDFRYRYWGTALTDLHGHDLTGGSVRQIEPEEYAASLIEILRRISKIGKPLFMNRQLQLVNGNCHTLQVLRLPFSSDQTNVEAIMALSHTDAPMRAGFKDALLQTIREPE